MPLAWHGTAWDIALFVIKQLILDTLEQQKSFFAMFILARATQRKMIHKKIFFSEINRLFLEKIYIFAV